MNSVVIGSTLKGLESALLLAKNGYNVTILCSGTYLGEDITGTWKWYPKERQEELRLQLEQVAKRFDLAMPQAEALYPGTIKRLFMEWTRSAGIRICYMTRLFGAVVQNNQLKGIVAADKQGLFYLPCTLAVDATLHQEATRFIIGNPLRFPKEHPLTIRMELRDVSCSALPYELKDKDAVLMQGIREESQAYLELKRYLPWEMSMQEVRSWALANIREVLPQLHQYPETEKTIPGETLPYILDLAELEDELKVNLDGWYTEIPDKFNIAASDSLINEVKLLVYGRYLALNIKQGNEVIIDWKLLPRKETDVLVAGAGTSGMWAAISAARAGAEVCAVEMLPYPGGTRVMGGVNYLYYGNRNRLFQSLWREIKEFTDSVMGRKMPQMLHIVETMFYISEMERNNIEFLSNTIACGAKINNENDLTSVLFCGENGPFLILVSLIVLVSCNKTTKSPLVGKWELTEEVSFLGITIYPKGSILEFYADGEADFMSVGCKYEDLGDKIKFIQGSDFFYIEYKLEGDTLKLKDEGGAGGALGYTGELVYKRVK